MSEDKKITEKTIEKIEVVEDTELTEEDLDEVAGGFYPWKPTEKPKTYYPIVPPSNSDN